MDWQLAISRNREALTRIIAALFALAGLVEGKAVDVLPRHIYRTILCVLRPAESAVRRLIIIAARGLVLAPRCVRGAPVNIIARAGAAQSPAFCLIDPLKRFVPSVSTIEVEDDDVDRVDYEDNAEGHDHPSLPRISVPGYFDPVFTPPPDPSSRDFINARHLGRRLNALKLALDNLPKQARRLARWLARRKLIRNQFPLRRGRSSPFRPGSPPGQRRRHTHEVHAVLRECHALMLDALAAPDTS
jgi:hypothetical protein